jgi:hypothetical protein
MIFNEDHPCDEPSQSPPFSVRAATYVLRRHVSEEPTQIAKRYPVFT